MKKINTIPFDTKRVPPKQNLFFMPLIWLACWFLTRSGRLKINKVNMKGLKPPYLVLGTHHAFMDFYVTPLALFPHRANYVSELEGFEAYGEWLYRQAGCLGTRKFINDTNLVKNIQRVMKRKGILVLYPEARYANVGTSSELPASVGKLIKLLKVPVVVINMQGNYLQSPIWNLSKRKGVKLNTTITKVLTPDQIKEMSVDNINSVIADKMQYDEYKYQTDNNIKITYKERAKGLHLPLYQCPVCEKEFSMTSEGKNLSCSMCKAAWEMDELGKLIKVTRDDNSEIDFSHIPDWYEWQRKCVHEEIDSGYYRLDTEVEVQALPNAVNFIDCGTGHLVHDSNGFSLTFTDYGDNFEKTLRFPPLSMLSVHTEYDYRKKGQCITLSTLDNTYFLFPEKIGFNATKIQFATEYLYKKALKQSEKST